MDIKQNSDGSLLKSSAETLLHFFWIAFNNFNMYGSDHPIAKKGAEDFYSYLNKDFNIITPIDFHMEGESFMCNKCIIDDKIKTQRLTDRFKLAGIHSISLHKGIAVNDLIELFILLNDSKNFQTAQKISACIKEKGINGIHLNYFTYKKVVGDNKNETELLTLAKKIASLNGIDQDKLIPVFIKDTEIAIKKITSNYIHDNQVSNIEELKNVFSHIKNNLMTELDKYGMKSDIISEINNQLSDRSDITLSILTAEWIINTVSYKKTLSNEQLIETLTDLFKKNKHLMEYGESIVSVLQERGVSKKALEEFIKKFQTIDLKKEINRIESEIDKKDSIKRSFKLPKGIMRVKETKKYLQNEIYRNLRYNSPLSCLSISVSLLTINSELKKPNIEELDKIFAEVTKILTSSLRTLDKIGSLGSLKYNHLIIILQMTDKTGSLSLKERLLKQLNNIKIEINGSLVMPIIVLSSVMFNKEKTPDINSFLREVRKGLKNQKKLIINI
jgi:hypothetical protein